MLSATRITADTATVTVVSDTKKITDWALRYFGSWWNATAVTVPVERSGSIAEGGSLLLVDVDSARLARELIRGQLLRTGFHILHASCAVRGGRRSSPSVPRARARPRPRCCWPARASSSWPTTASEDAGLRILPWPSAAAIGFGLLDSAGLYEPLRARVLDGEQMHPTQDRRVTDALHAGSTKPIWNAKGKELKPQFFPDQLSSLLHMTLATQAHAAALLFSQVDKAAEPHVLDTPRALGKEDFFTGKTEDRYPDIFRLAPDKAAPDTDLADRLAQLPRRALVLNHNSHTSAELLAKTAAGLLSE
ncbi:hypothetical protein ACIQM0_19080 [Streptomyces sp. NPDC091387]|uniref:hypothetical protein n=1 Tax=Streptomyces sp. NPDC091387 TaxID=3365998 RepID=UPI0038129C94